MLGCAGKVFRKFRFSAASLGAESPGYENVSGGIDFRVTFSFDGFRVAIPGVSKERRRIGIGIESGEFDRESGDIGDTGNPLSKLPCLSPSCFSSSCGSGSGDCASMTRESRPGCTAWE